jgi:hypothetical protein
VLFKFISQVRLDGAFATLSTPFGRTVSGFLALTFALTFTLAFALTGGV